MVQPQVQIFRHFFYFYVACVSVIYTAVYVVGCFMDDFVSLSVRELSSFHLFSEE